MNLNASCSFGSFVIKLSKVMSPCLREFEDSASFWIRFAVESESVLHLHPGPLKILKTDFSEDITVHWLSNVRQKTQRI